MGCTAKTTRGQHDVSHFVVWLFNTVILCAHVRTHRTFHCYEQLYRIQVHEHGLMFTSVVTKE